MVRALTKLHSLLLAACAAVAVLTDFSVLASSLAYLDAHRRREAWGRSQGLVEGLGGNPPNFNGPPPPPCVSPGGEGDKLGVGTIKYIRQILSMLDKSNNMCNKAPTISYT